MGLLVWSLLSVHVLILFSYREIYDTFLILFVNN